MTMRISSKTIYDVGVGQIGTLQTALARTQQQLATNRKNLTAADDPIATARALEVTQSQSINTQLVTNRSNAKGTLSLETVALASSTSILQDIKTLTVNAGNGGMTQKDRESLATELEGRLADLLGQANTADGTGGYVFSGYKSTTLPFTQTATGAAYQGDQGQRELQVGSTRKLPISDSGESVFENNATGNGTFVTGADPANFTRGGSGIISAGSVKDATQLTGHKYQVDFQVVPATPGTPKVTTYTVTDLTLNQPVPPAPVPAVPQPYVSGQNITFDGVQFDVKGDPADLDNFTVQPSTKQSIFTTVTDLIAALRAPGDGAAGQASLNNKLNQAHMNIDNATDNLLSIQSEVGSRLKELDYLDSSGDDLNLQYATTLSDLQDVDTVKAISLFTQQQTTLDAAQKSFKSLAGLSLFNYIT
ncbi:flagellar hook-associated protein 3 [Duganella sp. BJB488]|uniref:Flagellar hook-associated protein 3 n=1 Tax=Duganella vulcania TaxID=2692166 RepID=A0A845GBT6_9BURK|nr:MULTISPECIES: flagellar hook-associated protein FlgL [Duganella]MYM91754.1 flagellar hook-associated protein 3 [Duganella vulcania]NVD73842.1 flagellar hook-associated protein FlgL [Duganella sp. BJB1802]RFP25890.1 flagellar hook-associated protein 3 [Duganella sp. BJB489]RFP28369.1 flagellar hook-associated protein 3 [Duganella sp. BJB488]RFP36820.1 flagellar hook-associated protein 3 [Duganella sp. BJB480]